MNTIAQTDKLDILLGTVYDLNDSSEGVSNDLEILISQLVQQVEDMVDENDRLLGDLK